MKRVVIKLGGSILVDDGLRRNLIDQVAELRQQGLEILIVHGGGKQIASLLGRLGIESHFHDGLRVTDRAARDAAQMVLAGQVGKDLAAEFGAAGMPAVGLAGGDGLCLLCEKMTAGDGTDLGFVGRIVKYDSTLIEALLAARMVPVIACLALGIEDSEYYNINGDQMAAAVAAGCRADHLVFVTDVGGVRGADGNFIPLLDRKKINELLDAGIAFGGMRPKLRACLEALDQGVRGIEIIGAAGEKSLINALTGDRLDGTRIN